MKKIDLYSILSLLVLSSIVFVIGFFIALFFATKSGATLKNCLFAIGIAFTLIGFTLMSGIDLNSAGQLNSQYKAKSNIEVTKHNKEKINYFKNFKNHSAVNANSIRYAIVIGGNFMVLCSSL